MSNVTRNMNETLLRKRRESGFSEPVKRTQKHKTIEHSTVCDKDSTDTDCSEELNVDITGQSSVENTCTNSSNTCGRWDENQPNNDC